MGQEQFLRKAGALDTAGPSWIGARITKASGVDENRCEAAWHRYFTLFYANTYGRCQFLSRKISFSRNCEQFAPQELTKRPQQIISATKLSTDDGCST